MQEIFYVRVVSDGTKRLDGGVEIIMMNTVILKSYQELYLINKHTICFSFSLMNVLFPLFVELLANV